MAHELIGVARHHLGLVGRYVAYLVQALLRAVEAFLDRAITLKAFALFSLLFGAGLAIQFERLPVKRRVVLLLRRLVVLLAIGLLHMTLIWNGDILTEYALAGLLAAGAYAQDPNPQQQDMQSDKKDIRQDKKDLAKDRFDRHADQRDINNVNVDLAKDRRDRNADQRDLNRDKRDLAKDRKDRRKDQRDINKDKRDLHKDRKDLRADRRHR